MTHQINMKTLKEKIYENFKFKINRDTANPPVFKDYANKDIKAFYLVRFMIDSDIKEIVTDVITYPIVKLEIDKPNKKVYSVTGNFTFIETNKYTNSLFTQDNLSGILYRYVHAFSKYYDILLHPDYVEKFKEFLNQCINNKNATFYFDEVMDILNIDFENVPEAVRKYEYTIYEIDYLKDLIKDI